ncbi:M28 family peptidase [bacterium]|nr:M28 family peptidase [bacterium]
MKKIVVFLFVVFAVVFCFAEELYIYSVSDMKLFDRVQNACKRNIELGDKLLLLGGKNLISTLNINGLRIKGEKLEGNLYLAMSKDGDVLKYLGKSVKIHSVYGPYAVFSAELKVLESLLDKQNYQFKIVRLKGGTVVATQRVEIKAGISNPVIKSYIEKLDRDYMKNQLQHLINYQTRYSFMPQDKKLAEDMKSIFSEFGYQTEIKEFTCYKGKSYNIEAVKKGTSGKRIYLVGHVDSTSRKPKVLAPGGDDNGSGSVGVIAIARLIKDIKLKHDIIFTLFMGEEQGILGSNAYVQDLNNTDDILAVINMDMISFRKNLKYTFILESETFAKPFVLKMAEICKTYTWLKPEIHYRAWGSDHVPFLKKKIPTVLTIEKEYDINPNYHQVTDDMRDIDFEYMHEIIKLNLATVLDYSL